MTSLRQWKVCAGQIYRSLSGMHRRLRGRKPAKSLPILVIGSLRAGGGGKTPVVEWMARHFPEAAILVHPTPDEQVLLEEEFPGRVFAHRSLVNGWERAQKAGFAWAISDGGFQDPRLEKGALILVVNETIPQDAAQLHPFGRWRELDGVNRAQMLLQNVDISDLDRSLCLKYRWESFVSGGPPSGPVLLACGVGRPEGVREDLAGLGCRIVAEYRVRDHGGFSAARMREISRCHPGFPWVATKKDLPRWPKGQELPRLLEREWVPEEPETLLEWVRRHPALGILE